VTEDRRGLVQSLVIKAQRKDLDEIGAAVGTPVVYLKAAWADPVLYGGRGERVGSDLDVLVRPARFEAFAAELGARGYRKVGWKSPALERFFGDKEWSFVRAKRELPIDLHRALTNPCWYTVSSDEVIDRARPYDSVDGPILSLAPEDQILFGALHHANHCFDLDGRHREDVRRLIGAFPIDWGMVASRTRAARLRVALVLLLEALNEDGCPVPSELLSGPFTVRARRRAALAIMARRPSGQPASRLTQALDLLVLAPLLSERPSALLSYAAALALPRALEKLRGEVARPRQTGTL